MKNTDVLIIGGSAAGLAVATTGKSHYPDKKFLIVRKEEKVMIPCGIPYIFGSLESSEQNVLPADASYDKMGIDYMIGEIVAIDKKEKKCKLQDGEEIEYDKLILATGSTPVTPKWLKGADMENVFTIPKNKVYLDQVAEKIKDLNKLVIVGGGFIGVELSDELKKAGKDVTLVELMPHILSLAFDEELDKVAEETLTECGVKISLGIGVKEILGKDGKGNGVLLNNGDKLEADAVILSMGYHPNTKLAADSGIKINDTGFICVDEYMRTEDHDIIAVGDCAEKRDFVTRKQTGIMLASTACAEGRTAGMNLFKLSAVKTFSGTIAIFSTSINGLSMGAAGLTESQAAKEGFDVITGTFEGMDRHPGKLAGMHKQIVKLIVARESGVIIGGEVIGGKSIGELINLIGFIIQSKTNIYTLQTVQIGTHPLLTASPAAYPLINAANIVAHKMRSQNVLD
jgi:NADPH-dependent 2,4-dienoyl-CoA reductase/sulfur reductase-like enzyme